MITVYKKNNDDTLIELQDIEKNSWVNIIQPKPKELQEVSSKLGIPLDFFTDVLDPDERSRVEVEDNVKLLIIRAPMRNKKAGTEGEEDEVPFITIPVGIILTEENVVTISSNPEIVWELLSFRIITKDFSGDNRKLMVFRILQRTVLLFLKYLKEINQKIKAVEDELQNSMRNEDLMRLFSLEKSLVFFTTSLKSNELMTEKMLRMNILRFRDEDKDLLEDIIIDNRQAIEMSNIYSSILKDMMDTFSSIIGNNLNKVMKTLTSITIILMIPTLVSSYYGMNVHLPLQDHPHAFLFTLFLSFLLTAGGVMFFMKRNLF